MRSHLPIAAACILAAGATLTPAAFGQPERRNTARIITTRSGSSYLGIGGADLDEARVKALNLKEDRGVEIKSVAEDSPAAKAGLKEGDVVLDYNGQPVQGMEQFQRLVRETPAGREVKLNIWRGGAPQTVTATIGTRKGMVIQSDDGAFSFAMPTPPMPPIPPRMPDMPKVELTWRTPVLGIEGEALNSQLAEFFGVKEGVLIRSVIKNSPAEKAGIKAGDVVIKVDDSNVTSAREISSVIRSARNKKTFAVVVVRNKKEMTVNVTIEESSTSGTRAYGEGHAMAADIAARVREQVREHVRQSLGHSFRYFD
jgi:serine protease Do